LQPLLKKFRKDYAVFSAWAVWNASYHSIRIEIIFSDLPWCPELVHSLSILLSGNHPRTATPPIQSNCLLLLRTPRWSYDQHTHKHGCWEWSFEISMIPNMRSFIPTILRSCHFGCRPTFSFRPLLPGKQQLLLTYQLW
jgi:hypothetical protein